jgi:FSR family fosmidomycin resistance protein-like MFS transporter
MNNMQKLILDSLKTKLFLYSLLHLVVDGLCSYLIFAKLYPNNSDSALLVFILYNVLAFVTQAPVGIVIDKYNKPKIFLIISILCIIFGYILNSAVVLATVFIGVGNSFFHVCGGKYISEKSNNDIAYVGVFVSTGAVGLVLGQRLCNSVSVFVVFFSFLLIGSLILIYIKDEEYIAIKKTVNVNGEIGIFLAIISVVMIRSFVGKIASGEFEITLFYGILIAVATALGKTCGGIVSKIIGINKTAIISMTIAAFCLTLGRGVAIIYIIGVFAFNFSMPITLYFANELLRGREGFAFGSLAAFLIPGYFIAMSIPSNAVQYTVIPLAVLSVVLILITNRAFSLWKQRGDKK